MMMSGGTQASATLGGSGPWDFLGRVLSIVFYPHL